MQWISEGGDAVTHNMNYNNGRLIVKKEGFYYLYSKVQLNAADDCLLIQHKVIKETTAYGLPIELMKSKRFVRFLPSSVAGSLASLLCWHQWCLNIMVQ